MEQVICHAAHRAGTPVARAICGRALNMGQLQQPTAVLLIIYVLVSLALIALAITAWVVARRRRSERLARTFGPEYDRVLTQIGDKAKAESELEGRAKRHETLHLVPLSASERERLAQEWVSAQSHFVESPADAINEADRLLAEVMRRRGYPTGDFEQRAADISVDHPQTVESYRAAHAVAMGSRRGEASTEDLRQAMLRYHALFDDLLRATNSELAEAHR
jgi:hypothetical protein